MQSLLRGKLFWLLSALVLTGLLINSCTQPGCEREYSFHGKFPIYMSYDELRAGVFHDGPTPLDTSASSCYSGNYLFVNEFEKGIHVFDMTDPTSPQNIAFVHVPGNTQMTVNGNFLYANSYIDLVILDITNILDIQESGRLENQFEYRTYGSQFADQSKGVIVGWEEKDTVIVEDCGYNSTFMMPGVIYEDPAYWNGDYFPPSGMWSGYLSYYSTNGGRLYCMDEADAIIYDVSSPENPVLLTNLYSGGTSTFIQFDDITISYLILGANIYVGDPDYSSYLCSVPGANDCDKSALYGNYLFTLKRMNDFCSSVTDDLIEVYDITYIPSINKIATFSTTHPEDIAISGDWMFVIGDELGLQMFHIDAPDSISLFDVAAITDVERLSIADNHIVVNTKSGYHILSFDEINGLTELSTITE